MSFDGFGPQVFAWFGGLERDNSRGYFTATRATYDAEVRGGLVALLDELAGRLGGEPKVFRQHRDLRFTPDKTPYKTRTYGVLERDGQGYYAELSASGLYAGTGYYRMDGGQLDRYRAAVADDATGPALAEAAAAAEGAGLDVEGWSLKTAPRGYPKDHPRIELLRRKMLIAGRRLPGGGAGIGREAALEHVAGTWAAAGPLLAWLDEHVGPPA